MKIRQLVTGEINIAEMVMLYPDTAELLAEYGLGCAICSIGQIETLEQGILAHGFPIEECQNIIEELNLIANESVTE